MAFNSTPDKYELQKSLSAILQRTYQALLQYLRYKMDTTRQAVLLAYYAQVYGEAIKDPNLRLGLPANGIDLNELRDRAEQQGITIRPEKSEVENLSGFFLYDYKDYERLLDIVSQMQSNQEIAGKLAQDALEYLDEEYDFMPKTPSGREFVRVPGGFKSADGDYQIWNYNTQGDRYDPRTGKSVLNPEYDQDIDEWSKSIIERESAPSDEGKHYLVSGNGRIYDPENPGTEYDLFGSEGNELKPQEVLTGIIAETREEADREEGEDIGNPEDLEERSAVSEEPEEEEQEEEGEKEEETEEEPKEEEDQDNLPEKPEDNEPDKKEKKRKKTHHGGAEVQEESAVAAAAEYHESLPEEYPSEQQEAASPEENLPDTAISEPSYEDLHDSDVTPDMVTTQDHEPGYDAGSYDQGESVPVSEQACDTHVPDAETSTEQTAYDYSESGYAGDETPYSQPESFDKNEVPASEYQASSYEKPHDQTYKDTDSYPETDTSTYQEDQVKPGTPATVQTETQTVEPGAAGQTGEYGSIFHDGSYDAGEGYVPQAETPGTPAPQGTDSDLFAAPEQPAKDTYTAAYEQAQGTTEPSYKPQDLNIPTSEEKPVRQQDTETFASVAGTDKPYETPAAAGDASFGKPDVPGQDAFVPGYGTSSQEETPAPGVGTYAANKDALSGQTSFQDVRLESTAPERTEYRPGSSFSSRPETPYESSVDRPASGISGYPNPQEEIIPVGKFGKDNVSSSEPAAKPYQPDAQRRQEAVSSNERDGVVNSTFKQNLAAIQGTQTGIKTGAGQGMPGATLSPTGQSVIQGGSSAFNRAQIAGSGALGFAAGQAVQTSGASLQLKYGFDSINLHKAIHAPTLEGFSSSILDVEKGVIRGAGKEDSTIKQMREVIKPGHDVTRLVLGTSLHRSYQDQLRNYFVNGKLAQRDVAMLQRVLPGNTLTSRTNLLSAKELDSFGSSWVKSLKDNHLIVERSGHFIWQFDGQALTDQLMKVYGISSAEAAVFKNLSDKTMKMVAGKSMHVHGVRNVRMLIRRKLSNNNETLDQMTQGLNMTETLAGVSRSVYKAYRSFRLNRGEYWKAVKAAAESAQSGTQLTAAQALADFKNANSSALSPFRGFTREARAKHMEAVEQYRRLRTQERAERFVRNHRNAIQQAEGKLRQFGRFQDRANAADKVAENIRSLRHSAREAVANRVRASKVGQAAAALKEKFKATWIGQQLSKAAAKAGAATAKVAGAVEAAGSAISAALAPILLIVGLILLVFVIYSFVMAIIFVPIMMATGMERTDTDIEAEQTSNDDGMMQDVYDRSNTLTGTLYNELRFMEMEWGSELRSYGTAENPIEMDEITYTDKEVSVKDYVLSQAGLDDLLGRWAKAVDENGNPITTSKQFLFVHYDNQPVEGILGPPPFEGANLSEYKLLQEIDGGNLLEFRGKPMEGYTSNAKAITAMAEVFYGHVIDELQQTILGDSSFMAKAVAVAKNVWHAAWQRIEETDWLGGFFTNMAKRWSWTGIYRNYAYPIAKASHWQNYYLSSYLYPTHWTWADKSESPDPNARWDGARTKATGSDERSTGSQQVKVGYQDNDPDGGKVLAKSGLIGTKKEGGSGKVITRDPENPTAQYFSSDPEIYGTGNDNQKWEEYEYCPSDVYHGYGCQARLKFAYKWYGRANTTAEGEIIDYEHLTELRYLEEDGISVRKDVSPHDGLEDGATETKFGEDLMFNKYACTRHLLDLENEGSTPAQHGGTQCWTVTNTEETKIIRSDDYGRGDKSFINNRGVSLTKFNEACGLPHSERTMQNMDDVEVDGSHMIYSIEEVEDGYDVWIRLQPGITQKEIKDVHYEEGVGNVWTTHMEDRYENETTCVKYHFTHECCNEHVGFYCGGHLQLRTRGIIYGLSADQENPHIKNATEMTSYSPKFLDPDDYDESTGTWSEKEEYPDLEEFDANEHVASTAQIHVEDPSARGKEQLKQLTEQILKWEDLYDVDIGIDRKLSSYPGWSEDVFTKIGKLIAPSGEETDNEIEKWKSWTSTNMGNVGDMMQVDWFDSYNVPDTQTIVGGIYTEGDDLNAINEATKNEIIKEITDLLMNRYGLEKINMSANLLSSDALGGD